MVGSPENSISGEKLALFSRVWPPIGSLDYPHQFTVHQVCMCVRDLDTHPSMSVLVCVVLVCVIVGVWPFMYV